MRGVLSPILYTYAGLILFVGVLLAVFGFQLEVNMGSGSQTNALLWSLGVAVVTVVGTASFGYLAGRTGRTTDRANSLLRTVTAIVACAAVSFMLAIVIRNIFGTPTIGVVIGAAFFLPALMSMRTGEK